MQEWNYKLRRFRKDDTFILINEAKQYADVFAKHSATRMWVINRETGGKEYTASPSELLFTAAYSLAHKSAHLYFPMRGRPTWGGLRVIARGKVVNVTYGAVDGIAYLPTSLYDWTMSIPRTLPTLSYLPKVECFSLQARLEEETGDVRIQIPGKPYNREYGAAFVAYKESVPEIVKFLSDWEMEEEWHDGKEK